MKKTNYSLLYVEDDAFIRQNAVEFLEDSFVKIYEADCGQSGLDMFVVVQPDIIITDIAMSGMNGLEFCRKIREHDLQTPIIITTAFTDTSYLLEAVELGLVKYLVKPIEEEALFEALDLCFTQLEKLHSHVVRLSQTHTYDTLNHTLFKNQEVIKLSVSEAALLALLLKYHTRVVTYREIENSIYYDKGMSEDALKSLVRNLRHKLTKELIENHAKVGYKIKLYD